MTRPIVHFEIMGKDPAKLREFYAELFGWKINVIEPIDYGRVEAGVGGPLPGPGGGIGKADHPFVTVYVQVLSLDETLKKAESMGGKLVLPPMDTPNGPTIAQFADPEGNVIGLVKQ
jgi:predicted enzyme related to lactoylglutathione lyase